MRVNAVTVGTSKPRELAGFYARLLGAGVGGADDDWVEVRVPGGFTLGFERKRVSGRRHSTWTSRSTTWTRR
ncbi:hypothetical protein C8D87_101244 [Lentzea atacamensis]|uniref:Glyoxalase-like domain-containing protein n=1 Tax=Lentzea atacamensis TaxID=531938 RepID=A0ABX9EFJ1_9PSEU|nr:hypothetical protein [Lentzea atacamensis]RAS69944.1 hypothetical protein C8D87_101244 [Lentzea atacamensis]